MKLLRMTATFGRLDHETLTLTDGLNLLQLPNEAGKSTWAEFLLAMFYGVDTSEREKTGVLPVKTKYQPWNGKAMEGTVELEQDGRRLTLTRTSAARAPMSVFSAVYTDSGLPVEGLTGANCGERLLGVPKSVYQRSAFVRQAGLGLTPDESLESRLSALVTTGDETVSYAAADKRLQAWQNRVKHNKTGLIPDAERALAAVEENLQMGAYTQPNSTIEPGIADVYERFPRLEERKNQAAGTLSGGEQQMLAMGRALMSKPRILLLDEPSMGLSPLFVGEIFKIIEDVSKAGTTVLLVEQNAKKALSIADRGYVLETGRVVKTGKASDLLNDDSIKKAYLGE